ncbi:DNA-binding domain-containing protein [Ideonella sp. A 288]|uniref:HvfC/BufC N-terminal domain-containing protein n=1 Tax=Ideonella sp. A 288 TaxID=1962181 RepID=UPI000B4B6875|nr:DNA-binding domain-containing protein [Ideonella sp. A 288]
MTDAAADPGASAAECDGGRHEPARPPEGPMPACSARSASREREALRQQTLLRALWRDEAPAELAHWLRGDTTRQQRGLLAYQSNAAATAERALSAAHPVVQQLLGDEAFAALARHCWQQHAPTRGDLAHWGQALSAVVVDRAELAAEPYLADIARLEWALHLAQHAADAPHGQDGQGGPLGPPGLERLGTHDPARLRLCLRPGTAIVDSEHPIVTIWQAHQPGDGDVDGDGGDRFAAARAALAAGRAESALVFRDGWRPTACVVGRPAADFTRSLLQGATLGAALDSAGTGFSFEAWLRQALTQAWLVGVDLADG